jgi:hypothetical protein
MPGFVGSERALLLCLFCLSVLATCPCYGYDACLVLWKWDTVFVYGFLGTHSIWQWWCFYSCLLDTWNWHYREKSLMFFFCTCAYIGLEENVGPASCENSISHWSTSTCCATGKSLHMCCFARVEFACPGNIVGKFSLFNAHCSVANGYMHCSEQT